MTKTNEPKRCSDMPDLKPHDHDHDHGSVSVILYFVGLVLFLAALWMPVGVLRATTFIVAMLLSGYHVMLEGVVDTIQWTKQKGKFTPNVHILMTIAAVAAVLIGQFEEGSLLILIFAGAHFLEEYAEGKSKREITELLTLNPTDARLYDPKTGAVKVVPVSQLKIGDQVQVLNGDQVPTDGEIISGNGFIDESSISGESIPREKTVGDEVFGSTINEEGTFLMKVTKDSQDTVFAKILKLVEDSQNNLSKTATKIQKIEPIYVNSVLIFFPIFVLIGPSLFHWTWAESLYRGIVFLIIASPCALAASAVPATLSAISNLARQGVLFKGGSYLTNLAELKAVAFDKTGTLTEGKPVVTDVYFDEQHTQDKQQCIDIIVAMEKTANHPLAQAIVEHFQVQDSLNVEVENHIGSGLVTNYQGSHYAIGKPDKFDDITLDMEQKTEQFAQEGKTVVYFAVDQQVIALIALMDIPNEDAKQVVQYFKREGVHTTMITGDAKLTGEAVGRQLGIDEVVGNVLPENKATIIKEQQETYGMTAMLGDGVNDAPALVTADIGIAMGDGTDVAIDVADAVLMQNDLTKFEYAHRISKRLDRVVWQNIIFAMGVVVLLFILNILGKMDITVGVIAHEGSTILVIFNGLRLLIPLHKLKR